MELNRGDFSYGKKYWWIIITKIWEKKNDKKPSTHISCSNIDISDKSSYLHKGSYPRRIRYPFKRFAKRHQSSIESFVATGFADYTHGERRQRVTSPVLIARKNPTFTDSKINTFFRQATKLSISGQTIRRRFHRLNLGARRHAAHRQIREK